MNQQLAIINQAELNPYRPGLPESIKDVSADLFSFLRELTETVRAQHNMSQAGDSTFSWEVLTQTSPTKSYNLGSLGRFYHPDYGLLRARYCQFTQLRVTEWLGAPLGFVVGGANWQVTNDIALSSRESVLGLGVHYTQPEEGAYGWVLVDGPNLQTLPVNESETSQFEKLVWGGNFEAASDSSVAGMIFASVLKAQTGELAPGTVFVKSQADSSAALLGGVTAQISAINAELLEIQEQLSLLQPADEATLESQVGELIEQLSHREAQVSAQLAGLVQSIQTVSESIPGPDNSVEAELENVRQALLDNQNVTDSLRGYLGVKLQSLDAAVAELTIFNKRNSDGVMSLGTQIGDIKLTDLEGATAGAMAQANRDIDVIFQTLARLNDDHFNVRTTMRNAGIITDPANGRVTIFGVDQTQNYLSETNLTLNALTATVSTKASVTYVNNQIAAAALDPSGLPTYTALEIRVSTAETEIDGLNASILLKASIVSMDDLTGRVSTAETDLSALTGVVSTKASQTTVTALDTRVTAAETTLGSMDAPTITSTVRVARLTDESGAQTLEDNLWDVVNRGLLQGRTVAQIGVVTNQITTKINSDMSVEAGARLELTASVNSQLGVIRADAVNETVVRAAADSALGLITTGLQTQVSNNLASAVTQFGTLTTNLSALATTVTSLSSSTSTNFATVNSSLTTLTTTTGSLSSSLTSLTTTVGGLSSTVDTFAGSIDGIEAKWGVRVDVNDRITGILLNNDGDDAGFELVADYFKIWPVSGGTGTAPFDYRDGILRVHEIAVDRISIQSGAVNSVTILSTNPAQVFTPGNMGTSWPYGGSALLSYTTPTLPDGIVAIRVSVMTVLTVSSDLFLWYNGIKVGSALVNAQLAASALGGRIQGFNMTYVDSLPMAGKVYSYMCGGDGSHSVATTVPAQLVIEFIYR